MGGRRKGLLSFDSFLCWENWTCVCRPGVDLPYTVQSPYRALCLPFRRSGPRVSFRGLPGGIGSLTAMSLNPLVTFVSVPDAGKLQFQTLDCSISQGIKFKCLLHKTSAEQDPVSSAVSGGRERGGGRELGGGGERRSNELIFPLLLTRVME